MFQQQEERLRTLIARAHTPVLGLLGGLLPIDARNAVRDDVRVMPSVRSFVQRLEAYPALFGVWLAEHVMYGLGASGHFDVYPHIRKALGGVTDLNITEKEYLWRAFRRAILKLGIQPLPRTSGAHYMANEYVRQAGVPLRYADDLARKMILQAKRIGAPDEDDQDGLLTWQASLLSRLQMPFSVTAKRAVERDSMAYYTRAFLRVFANQGQPTHGDALEAAFATAFINEGGTGNIKRAAIPQLLYRDGVLGVLFPATSIPTRYEIKCGASVASLRLDEEGDFRQLPSDLPAEVEVLSAEGERLLAVKLWADGASNRLLVFNEAGRLKCAAQLGQAEAVELPPGRYVALCRFTPTNISESEELSDEPRLVDVLLDIQPGVDFTLHNGPAQVTFAGENLPSFRLEGPIKASLERVEFHYGRLTAVVNIPADWRQVGQQAFEIRVSAGSASSSTPLALGPDGAAIADLHDAVRELGFSPGMRRLVIELGRVGDARAFQRQSLLYWVGLSSISFGLRFTYALRPQNIISSACVGLNFEDKQAEPSSELARVLRLGFEMGDGRVVYLSWNRPGVFVEVEVLGRDGSISKVPRPLGSTETVSLTHTKNVVVSASEPGFVTLGEWRQFVDFSHRPSKSFPASFLASRMEPGARTLSYRTQKGAEVSLLQLSQPHVATAVSTSRLANVFDIRIALRDEPTDIGVRAKDLASGRQAHAEHELLGGEWRTNNLARMQAYCASDTASTILNILLDVNTVPAGLWTLEFDARIGGAWGSLEDADEGRLVVVLALDQVGQENRDVLLADVEELDVSEAVARLAQLNEHFRSFWSAKCWEQQAWLAIYWTKLLERVRGAEETYLTQLVDMAMSQGPDEVRQGWVPKQCVGAQLPSIFARQRASYSRVNLKAHPLSVALRAIAELHGALVQAFGVTLHQVSAVAFKNVGEVMRGRRPRDFVLSNYLESIRQSPLAAHKLDDESFLPGPGELLGPLHLAHAWRDLESRYSMSLLMPLDRKTLALSLSRMLYQRSSRFDSSAPAGLQYQPLVLRLKPYSSEDLEETEQQRQENLTQIANACAWFAWYCRLEVRRPGSLTAFLGVLASIRRKIEIPWNGAEDCLAFYLHVAPAMFAYYLLLWELVLAAELDPVVQHV